ncbi:MAG: glycosyltransferase family 4 protein [Bacteroidales bacterium]|nr:glycosyltransferase family 4 protein [Bacteroidales bacterium]
MKVLMFGWEYPPHITGGLGTACYGLVKGLAKQGINVILVVPRLWGGEDNKVAYLLDASEVELDERIVSYYYKEYFDKIKYYAIDSILIPYVSPQDFEKLLYSENIKGISHVDETVLRKKFKFSGKYGENLYAEVARYSLIAGVIARENPHDIIHAHDWLTYPAGIVAKEISKKPLIIHVHATEFDRSGENINQYVYNIEKIGMEAADRIITVSYHTRNIVINKYGINPDKVFTVHNAIDPYDIDKIRQNKGFPEKLVTFLGRITFQKGPDYFVEAAYKVYQKDQNIRFVMAGSGDMLNRMIRQVARYRMGHKFQFTGFLKGEDVYRLFLISDVYVMPSVSEPFGISPLEAMYSNVPVIISKQSGVSEVLKYAIKVDFWDIDALADAIYALTHYNGISNMFRKYGKQEVINMKWDNSAKKVIEIYKSAIGVKCFN